MPIQFVCTSCGQPIEVDDEYAGQSAACPYCRTVVSVPPESTYHPEATVQARRVEPARLGGLEPLEGPGGAPTADALGLRARKLGGYALLCTGAAVALIGILFVVMLSMMLAEFGGIPESQEQIESFRRHFPRSPLSIALSIATLLFSVLGLVFGIVSVSQRSAGNWRGWVAVVICGAFVVCNCAGPLLLPGMAGQ